MYGFAGQILRVDLSRKKVWPQTLASTLFESYLGGAGVAGKLLYDEVPPQTDPYSPDNKVVLMTGPLTATELPGAVNYSIATKSPVAGLPVVTNANGSMGRKLKFAGFDGIVIEGASQNWSYLVIDDGQARLLDAAELLGKDVYQTDDILKKRHGASAVVGCIGPSGERLVRFSGFLAEKEHSASKGGVGSVLGSKRLKAIVVKSTNKSVPVFDEDLMSEVMRRWRLIDDKVGSGARVSQRGMRGGYEERYEQGTVPVRNLTTQDFPGHERLNYDEFARFFQIRRNSCPTCNFNHFNRFLLNGEDLKEPSFDTLVGYGPNIGVSDPVELVRLVTLVDRLGLESQETSWLLSLLMECYHENIIGKEQLDGEALPWGDHAAAARLVEKTAWRQGCGDRFAGGVYMTAHLLGPGALERAVYAKRGFVPQLMDNRNDWAFSFAEAMSSLGHYEALPNASVRFFGGEDDSDVPLGIEVDELALHHTRSAPRTQVIDCLGICFLHGASGDLSLLADALRAATGVALGTRQLFQAGCRFITMMRLYALKCGLDAGDDTLSPRYLSPPSRGVNAGRALADYLPRVSREYYRLMGWNDAGVPLPETLRRLGIEA